MYLCSKFGICWVRFGVWKGYWYSKGIEIRVRIGIRIGIGIRVRVGRGHGLSILHVSSLNNRDGLGSCGLEMDGQACGLCCFLGGGIDYHKGWWSLRVAVE